MEKTLTAHQHNMVAGITGQVKGIVTRLCDLPREMVEDDTKAGWPDFREYLANTSGPNPIDCYIRYLADSLDHGAKMLRKKLIEEAPDNATSR